MFHGCFLPVGGLHLILLRVSFDEEAFLILRKANFSVFLFKNFYLFLAALGLYWFAQAFSACGEWGLLFTAVFGLQWWEYTGLAAPRHVESAQTRDWTRVPYIGRHILIHCATKGSPSFFSSMVIIFCVLSKISWPPLGCKDTLTFSLEVIYC